MAKRVNGDIETLKRTPIRAGSDQTWCQRRNNFCKRHRGQVLARNEPIKETSGPYAGTPTRRELGMIMWLCSNFTEDELRAMLPRVRAITTSN